MAVGHREHADLHRRQPDREAAAVVLDQDAGEALHRAEQGAVDHHRPVLGVVLALVDEIEALGHREVELAQHARNLAVAHDPAGKLDIGDEALAAEAAAGQRYHHGFKLHAGHAFGDVDGLAGHLLGLHQIDHGSRP